MNGIKVQNRFKLAIKRALSGEITGQDIKAIIEFQNRDLIEKKGENLDSFELNLLTAYSISFN